MRVGGIDAVATGKRVVQNAWRDDVTGMAAELAYRFFLALFPFFIFVGALGGFLAHYLGVDDPTGYIVDLLGEGLPPAAAGLVRDALDGVIGERNPGLLSFGVLGALWVATGGTNTIIKAMNRAYTVEESRPFWKRYFTALWLTALAGTSVLAAFFLLVTAEVLGWQLALALGITGPFGASVNLLRWPAVVLVVLLAAVYVYRVAPNVRLPWKWVLPGAATFALGWVVVTYLFTIYVGSFANYGTVYGTLGGVAILLVWLYITAFILLIGAELNAVIDEQLEPEQMEEQRRERRHEARRRREGQGEDARHRQR